jgi:quercetin dioxygenase-like cupin family protein
MLFAPGDPAARIAAMARLLQKRLRCETLSINKKGDPRVALLVIEGKDMHAWVTEFAPDVSTGKHHHPWHEFVYVLEGDFTIEVQGEPAVTLKPGEIITLAPKQVHEGKSSPNSPTKVLVFGLAPKDEPLVVQVE